MCESMCECMYKRVRVREHLCIRVAEGKRKEEEARLREFGFIMEESALANLIR